MSGLAQLGCYLQQVRTLPAVMARTSSNVAAFGSGTVTKNSGGHHELAPVEGFLCRNQRWVL